MHAIGSIINTNPFCGWVEKNKYSIITTLALTTLFFAVVGGFGGLTLAGAKISILKVLYTNLSKLWVGIPYLVTIGGGTASLTFILSLMVVGVIHYAHVNKEKNNINDSEIPAKPEQEEKPPSQLSSSEQKGSLPSSLDESAIETTEGGEQIVYTDMSINEETVLDQKTRFSPFYISQWVFVDMSIGESHKRFLKIGIVIDLENLFQNENEDAYRKLFEDFTDLTRELCDKYGKGIIFNLTLTQSLNTQKKTFEPSDDFSRFLAKLGTNSRLIECTVNDNINFQANRYLFNTGYTNYNFYRDWVQEKRSRCNDEGLIILANNLDTNWEAETVSEKLQKIKVDQQNPASSQTPISFLTQLTPASAFL